MVDGRRIMSSAMAKSIWTLDNGRVRLGVSAQGGNLWPVRFMVEGRAVEPLHRAPWVDEPWVAADAPPMLQNLRGDFFCAPFGANDLDPREGRDHGPTANGTWRLLEREPNRLALELEGQVAGARVTREVRLEQEQPVVYQVHRFEGGSGPIPLGHHAMLRAPERERLHLSFAPFAWGGTPPEPVEPDASRGRSSLRYPQRFDRLSDVETRDGPRVDLSAYPALQDTEDILMLVTEPGREWGWSAAVAPGSGWIWFAVRRNDTLRNTLLWMSNGGRDYPPFLGRHRRVIGIEETTSFFHLGHRRSVEPNELSAAGFPTAVPLEPERTMTTRYAFGAVAAPRDFDRVAQIEVEDDCLSLRAASGQTATVPFTTGLLRGV